MIGSDGRNEWNLTAINRDTCEEFADRWTEFIWIMSQRDNAHFKIGITMRAILIGFLILSNWKPARLRKTSAVNSSSWDQKKLITYRQGALDAVFRPLDFQQQFLSQSAFFFLWHLSDIILPDFREKFVPRFSATGIFLPINFNDGQYCSFNSEILPFSEKETYSAVLET